MNIREVVAALAAKADKMPAGWDTEVRVSRCHGNGVEITTDIEVDHMAEIDLTTHAVNTTYAIVQGHPHRDEQAQQFPGITAGADEALQRWANEDSTDS